MDLPQNVEAEKALLSSLFLDPDKFISVAEIITAECFYNTRHQAIYSAIERLHIAGENINTLSVYDELKKAGPKVLTSELAEISSYYPTAELAEHLAETVKGKHVRRAAIAVMQRGIVAAQDEMQGIQDTVATIQKQLDSNLPGERKISGIFPEIVHIAEKIIDTPAGGYKNYIPTGFVDLDNSVLLCNGTLTIIGAAPRVGKTSFALCVMRNIEKQGKRALLFTLEMTRARVIENLIVQETGVPYQEIVRGQLTDMQSSAILNAAARYDNSKLSVLDGRWSAGQIRNRALREKREKGLDIIFVDALGKIPPPEGMSRAKRHETYETNAELLDNLAIELNVPVVVTHHLNREGAKGRPTLFDLNEAGEKFADNVILIMREYLMNPTRENKNIAEFIVAKNRDGDVDTIKLGWDGPTKSFYSVDTRRAEDRRAYWNGR